MTWVAPGPVIDKGSRVSGLLVPEPGKPVFAWATSTVDPTQQEQWVRWPLNPATHQPIRSVDPEGIQYLSYAKPRPALVLSVRNEIEGFGHALVLPLSRVPNDLTVAGRTFTRGELERQPLAFVQFLPGDARFADSTVDFRWAWRARRADLLAARHEATLDDDTLLELVLRYRNYLLPLREGGAGP